MQVSNLSHDVNSNVLLNFVICFKGLMAVRTDQLHHLGFLVCSWTDIHVLNNLLLVDEVSMAEWTRIVDVWPSCYKAFLADAVSWKNLHPLKEKYCGSQCDKLLG